MVAGWFGADAYRHTPTTFSTVELSSRWDGVVVCISDSNTSVIGAPVTAGSGSFQVLARSYGNSTNWYVIASSTPGISDGPLVAVSTVSAPAGGSTTARLSLGSDAALGVYFGSGAPSVSASQGSLYLRTDGASSTTRIYVGSSTPGTWIVIETSS